MNYEELLDITPGMFLALNKQVKQQAEGRMFGFQFLATVVARIAGNKDADFMPGKRRANGWEDGEGLETFLESRLEEINGKEIDQSGESGCTGSPDGER